MKKMAQASTTFATSLRLPAAASGFDESAFWRFRK
jgi:hypothetical protein